MALNKVDVTGGRLTLQGDYVLHHQDNIEFMLEGDRLPANMKSTIKGDMFISNMRLIFVNKGGKGDSGYNSFSMNFDHIRNTEVKQPIFGANYIKGYIIAEPNGGWEGNANFNVYFPKGGAIDFAEKFQKAVKDSLRNRQNGVTPHPPMEPVGYMPAPQMGYAPQPGYGQQPGYPPQAGYAPQAGYPPQAGYAPQQGYPGYPPPQESLYVYNQSAGPPQGAPPNYAPPQGAPPPYNPVEGVNTQTQQAGNPKAHEAYMSGNTAYVPNNEQPPPYNPSYPGRKDQ